MTDQELKDLVASLVVENRETAAMQRETDRLFKESCEEARHREQEAKQRSQEADRRSQEADRRSQEADRRSQEADRRLEELEKKLERVGIKVGGVSNNIGHHAEQFFQDVFKKKLEFGGVKYDEMVPNMAYKGKKDYLEFDIALVNGESVALIEVKNRIHPDFVKILAEERVEKFREFFHEFDNYDVYLGIAGFSFSDEVLDQASRYGIGIVKQVGEGVEIEANNLKAY
jgi:ATPase subunit of ABC transporter with duplicated ATPase domains